MKDDSTERQEPKQPPEKLRFLGHSLTAFGHDSAASVTGSIKGRGGMKCEKRLKGCRFSIGSAPLTSITKSDAQISGGETRQDYKDPRRFPLVAPSCALLFLPFGLPVSFRCYGRVYLIPRLTLGSGKAVRSKLDCMHEPPVQPDYHVVPVTIILSPTRNRHEKSPVAVAISKRIHGAE